MEVRRGLEFLEGLGDYFVATHDGICFMDPLYSEEIRGDRPPRCVREHPQLAIGQQFLQRKSKALKIHLITALHGQPKDFAELTKQCGDKLTDSIVGIEADWAHQPEKIVSDVIFSDQAGRAAFQRRQINWLQQRGTLALPCEYFPQNDSEDPLTQKMTTLWNTFLKASDDMQQNPGETVHNRIANLTFWSCQSIRQWAILGRFGYWLRQLEEHDAGLPSEVSLILGVGHEPSAERLSGYFGNQIEPIVIQHSRLLNDPDFQNYMMEFYNATTKGFATYEQLDTPFIL